MARAPKRLPSVLVGALLLACVEEHVGDLHAPEPRVHEAKAPASAAVARAVDGARLTQLEPIGVYAGDVEPGAYEIAVFDPASARLFVTTGEHTTIDVLDLSDPTVPSLVGSINLRDYGGPANSVDIADGVLAIAIAAVPAQQPGTVLFMSVDELAYLNHVSVDALPDMLTFSPDGRKLVIACEGEPSDDGTIDPKGSVAIIDLSHGRPAELLTKLRSADVAYASFDAYDFTVLDPRVHVDRRSASVAQDLEPEFVAVSADSKRAWVSLQENNAVAIVDLDAAKVTEVIGLGVEHHVRFPERPVFAMRQPDALAWAVIDDRDYVVTANEGDCRSYTGRPELTAARSLTLDPTAFPDAAALQRDDALGRLPVSAELGDRDHDGDYDELYVCGSGSISLWDEQGRLVWDSGGLLAQVSSPPPGEPGQLGEFDPGPGPEGVVVAELWGRSYAFVGLESAGGIAVFELEDASAPSFVLYQREPGDMGPEGLELITAADSPIGEPLLIVANEISRTVRVYRIVGQDGGGPPSIAQR